jgi:hypothetical protein
MDSVSSNDKWLVLTHMNTALRIFTIYVGLPSLSIFVLDINSSPSMYIYHPLVSCSVGLSQDPLFSTQQLFHKIKFIYWLRRLLINISSFIFKYTSMIYYHRFTLINSKQQHSHKGEIKFIIQVHLKLFKWQPPHSVELLLQANYLSKSTWKNSKRQTPTFGEINSPYKLFI